MNLVLLGSLFLVGLVADVLGRRTFLPRVSFLLLSGLLIGPSALGIIPSSLANEWFPTLTHMALGMVGFLMGQSLNLSNLREQGMEVVIVSLSKAIFSAIAVFLLCVIIQLPIAVSAVLAGIATATAPAATFDVVHELGLKGRFPDLLINVVALDDVWGLLLFSLLLAFAVAGPFDIQTGAVAGLSEVLGSVALGGILGVPMAYLTGRIVFGEREGEPILAESLGFVFLAVGASEILEFSPILTCICMGAIVSSFATHHLKPFNAIEGVEWPFMILFFVLAGASLELEYLSGAGWLVLSYILARVVGILIGVELGGRAAGIEPYTRRMLGFGLFPQAGVALGMALMAAHRLPMHAQLILTVTLASTVVLELVSPAITKVVLRKHAKHMDAISVSAATCKRTPD